MKELPSITADVQKAKETLQGCKTKSSNLYNDFSKIIEKTLTERAGCVIELLEDYSANEKPKAGESDEANHKQATAAEQQMQMFLQDYGQRDETGGDDEEFEIPIPNSLHLAHYFEQAGLGLSREEVYKMSLAMKYLVYTFPLSKARFWGKIFGTEKPYYVAEVEYREGEGDEGEDEEEEEKASKEAEDEKEEDEDTPAEEDNLPINNWKPPPPIIKEDHHQGTNRYVYFVCNSPGGAWQKLPHVAPEEITCARQINKFFTGHLDKDVVSYPPFPGKEANLLRAQIARISASTIISPAGYYMFDDEEEEEEEEEFPDSYMENTDFDGVPLRELIHPSMSSWVHHYHYILPQGRCTWYNPYERPEDDFEEEEEEEEEQNLDQVVQEERGPALLSCVADDKGLGHVPAWSTYASSRVLPDYAVAVARSNLWPGAFAIAKDTIFENIYVGWGKKYSLDTYAPPPPPQPLPEYPVSQEIEEALDPTVEEEKAFHDKQEANKASEDLEDDDVDDDDEDD